jgi:hypothetical protein
MTPLIASVGGLGMATLGSLRAVVASVPGVPSAGGASQCTASVEVIGASARLGDDTGSLLFLLVVRNVGAGVSGSATLGEVAPAPRSSSAACPRVFGVYLPGSPGI